MRKKVLETAKSIIEKNKNALKRMAKTEQQLKEAREKKTLP